MPQALIADPTPPSLQPQNASVFDSPVTKAARRIASFLGLTDPNQIMALGLPMSVGPETGGLVDALASKFPRLANFIKAYHGSPHDFERFDASKIGTGEGAAAYGHGLYFAENPAVAEEYRKALSRAPIGWSDDYPMSAHGSLRVAADDVAAGRITAAQAARRVYNVDANMRRFDPDQVADDIATVAEKLKGKTYEVAIHASPDQFLDWDQPLSQQSPSVQQALQGVAAEYRKGSRVELLPSGGYRAVWSGGSMGPYETQAQAQGVVDRLGNDPTGAQLYGAMESASGRGITNPVAPAGLRKGAQSASEMLRDAGVPGIKYLDAGSRAAGTGSRNFVVFDDQTIDILRKYGLLLPAAGLTGAASQTGGSQ